jgi:hypothetical protein
LKIPKGVIISCKSKKDNRKNNYNTQKANDWATRTPQRTRLKSGIVMQNNSTNNNYINTVIYPMISRLYADHHLTVILSDSHAIKLLFTWWLSRVRHSVDCYTLLSCNNTCIYLLISDCDVAFTYNNASVYLAIRRI